MKRFTTLFLVAMAVLLSQSVRAEVPGASTDEQQILAIEQEWIKAEPKHDAATLDRILHDQFVSRFGTGKPLAKRAFIADVTDGPVDPTLSHTLSDQTVIISGDTAIVMETDTIRRTQDGKLMESVHRITVTYIRREGRWQALAEQSARVTAKN